MTTQARLKQLLTYNPDTGIFTWNMSRGRVRAGSVAGYRSSRVVFIKLDKVMYSAHRLAFLYMTGQFPSAVVDHKNGNPFDNRWTNLRACSLSENQHNRVSSRNSAVPYLGVHKHRQKYRASIMVNKVNHRLGTFETAEEARDAYLLAKARLHPTNPCVRNE